ncbi:Mediator of RNA polymerase II transcription subunit 10 [Hondaea fermentalgiana]|uniref:Mediator of RNA polymerase II transcription subunit 10 n=1 Tax=Hondaea fermentalgiana TaxID=2315210 RepID=A0A2R5G5E4_9STRA|nr:Mediator of RNA polymerase II transcription subunit 10 [Hondaea fermentalgiana]|eukprot:GBG26200.1 Mediator of RNA polymerase II transcription subunit 10 [Hondaea fermentalgiana]
MKAIQDALAELDETARLVGEFYDDDKGTAQKEMFERVNNLIGHFEKVDGMRTQLDGLRVPVDFLDHLDQVENANPELYTRYKADYLLEEKERKRRVAKDMQTIKEEISAEMAKGLDKAPSATETADEPPDAASGAPAAGNAAAAASAPPSAVAAAAAAAAASSSGASS